MFKHLKPIHGFILNTFGLRQSLSPVRASCHLKCLKGPREELPETPWTVGKRHVNMYEKFKKGPNNLNSKSCSVNKNKKYDFGSFLSRVQLTKNIWLLAVSWRSIPLNRTCQKELGQSIKDHSKGSIQNMARWPGIAGEVGWIHGHGGHGIFDMPRHSKVCSIYLHLP